MRIQDLQNKATAVWGLGREGRSILRVLQERLPGLRPAVLSDAACLPQELETAAALGGGRVLTGAEALRALPDFDVVIKSPGISRYRPEIQAAVKDGVRFTSATALWFAEHPDVRAIGVTGSKGKSTTSALIAHLLRAAGCKAALAGNIGAPVWELSADKEDFDWWVIELSSYQTCELESGPAVAVLLNLYPEHLDWHGSAERYFADKLRLLEVLPPGGCAVVHPACAPRVRLAPERSLLRFDAPEGIHAQGEALFDGPQRLFGLGDFPLKGEHNRLNLCAALAAVKAAGIDPGGLGESLASFAPLPHRLQILGTRRGVTYVDDSISTIAEAAMAAVKAFAGRPITLLLGGFDRGQDWGPLAAFLARGAVQAVVTMGPSGVRMAAALRKTPDEKSPVPLFEVQDLEEAVRISGEITPAGGVVLLSPASASYGAFADFEERGRRFAALAGF